MKTWVRRLVLVVVPAVLFLVLAALPALADGPPFPWLNL
jgi:hypothetical protein